MGHGEPEPEPEKPKGRTTPVRPHELDRRNRQMNITWPDADWIDAVQAEADRWGCRPCDVLVYAFAQMMDRFQTGQPRPRGQAKFHHRAGEMLDLPWEPE
jgi:hypothetical protein